MINYMKGFRRYLVTVTAGVEHTATTFTDAFWARNAADARGAAERKWTGAAIGAVVGPPKALTAIQRDGGASFEASQNAGLDY